jgi:GT2 family glycosyltransferase
MSRMNYIIVTNSIKRSSQLVERSLRASLNQKNPPMKVILIDQNKSPIKLSEDIINNHLFERQQVNHRGVSAARNALVIPEGAEWIFFCDDDGYPCTDYSEIMKEIISDYPKLEILAGSIVREDTKEYYSFRHKKGGSLAGFRNTKNLMGSNFVIRTEVFNKLGRFDEAFGAGSYWGSSEETDFCWKAYFAHIKMEYFKELIVYHVPPFNESVKLGFRKSFRYGVGKGALVWKWLFRKKKMKVFYELIEMIVVPFIQMIRGLIALKFQLMINNFATLAGRLWGLVKAAFKSPYTL